MFLSVIEIKSKKILRLYSLGMNFGRFFDANEIKDVEKMKTFLKASPFC